MRKILRAPAITIPQTVRKPLLVACGVAVGLASVALLADRECFASLVRIGGTAMGLMLSVAAWEMWGLIRTEAS